MASRRDGRFVSTEIRCENGPAQRLLIGVCNKLAQGGGLGKQIQELQKRAGEATAVVVRSTAFPSNPKAAVSLLLGKLVAAGGRRVVVEDSDWRTMLAFGTYCQQQRSSGEFSSWQARSRPLTGLESLRAILNLDKMSAPPPPEGQFGQQELVWNSPGHDGAGEPTSHPADTPPGAGDSPDDPAKVVSLIVGTSSDRRADTISVSTAELTKHAAFIGAPGSGKTTLALGLIEQLLLQGIPAILIDRKGDLCSYARPGMSLRSPLDGVLAERAERLRCQVEVALYTPRRSDGRPLSIAAVPAGLGALPEPERRQAARFAASALGGMMNYAGKKTRPAKLD
jgi:hypothetical protein